MSRKALWILLAVAMLLAGTALAVILWGEGGAVPPGEQKGTEFVERSEEKASSDAVSAPEEAQAQKAETAVLRTETEAESYEFKLVDQDNYVAVYRLPENEIYEYTDVILDVLPESVREEIRRGKYVRDEEELYNFLENYTS